MTYRVTSVDTRTTSEAKKRQAKLTGRAVYRILRTGKKRLGEKAGVGIQDADER